MKKGFWPIGNENQAPGREGNQACVWGCRKRRAIQVDIIILLCVSMREQKYKGDADVSKYEGWSKRASANMSALSLNWLGTWGQKIFTWHLKDKTEKDRTTWGNTQMGARSPWSSKAVRFLQNQLWMHPNSFRWFLPVSYLHTHCRCKVIVNDQ